MKKIMNNTFGSIFKAAINFVKDLPGASQYALRH